MTAPTHREPNRWFWLTLPVGAVFVATGVDGILRQHDLTRPTDLARWFAGAGIFHDAVLAPALVGVGLVTARLPAAAHVPVRVALAASALVIAFAWPLVRGWGQREANPSALPLDYGRNLAVTLITIWLIAVCWTLERTRRSSR